MRTVKIPNFDPKLEEIINRKYPDKEFLSIKELSELLGRPYKTIWRWVVLEEIFPYIQPKEGRTILIPKQRIIEILTGGSID